MIRCISFWKADFSSTRQKEQDLKRHPWTELPASALARGVDLLKMGEKDNTNEDGLKRKARNASTSNAEKRPVAKAKTPTRRFSSGWSWIPRGNSIRTRS